MHLIKKSVTLLEVLIGMVLTVVVLTTLIFFYKEVAFIGSEIEAIKVQQFYSRYAENRLSNILTRIISPNDKKGDFIFFSLGDEGLTKLGSQSLVFVFDNGVSLDKDFSNHVLGRLYLDPLGRLSLAYWPSPKRWGKSMPPMKKEILLEGVESLFFEFFIPPDKNPRSAKTQQKDPEQIPEPKGDWRRQPWLREFQQLPAIMKVIIKLSGSGEVLLFTFPLPNSKSPIIYD